MYIYSLTGDTPVTDRVTPKTPTDLDDGGIRLWSTMVTVPDHVTDHVTDHDDDDTHHDDD